MFEMVEPLRSGMLATDDGQKIYWEASGNPEGKPVVYLHGGPGSGMGAGYRRWFNPELHFIVGFDQRGCGRSRPLVLDDLTLLASNTTQHLISDMEALRQHLEIDQWLVVGSSWGTTLALAYAQAHPARVTEIALLATTLTDAAAVEWITETVGCIFPEEWDEFRAAANAGPEQRLVDAYYALLTDRDPNVREQAAISWDRWEYVHVSLSQTEPGPRATDRVRRQVFCNLVTHYWSNAAFLPDGQLVEGMNKIRHIPGILVHGKLDVSGPAATPWQLHKLWPESRYVLIADEGHGGRKMVDELIKAIEAFGTTRYGT